MDVKEAMEKAKTYFADAFAGEELWEIELEEIAFDYENDVWKITIGFQRPWDAPHKGGGASPQEALLRRSYKTFRIDDGTGALLNMTHRPLGDQANGLPAAGPAPWPVLN